MRKIRRCLCVSRSVPVISIRFDLKCHSRATGNARRTLLLHCSRYDAMSVRVDRANKTHVNIYSRKRNSPRISPFRACFRSSLGELSPSEPAPDGRSALSPTARFMSSRKRTYPKIFITASFSSCVTTVFCIPDTRSRVRGTLDTLAIASPLEKICAYRRDE